MPQFDRSDKVIGQLFITVYLEYSSSCGFQPVMVKLSQKINWVQSHLGGVQQLSMNQIAQENN